MRALQLRDILQRVRHPWWLFTLSLVVALMVSGCGGGNESANTSSQEALPITVTAADGASVSMRTLQREAAQQVTVRVAQDGTGAPPLPDGYTSVAAVYQFTPLGWVEEAIEIRVPFASVAGGDSSDPTAHLLIAQPGGQWLEASDARREGNFMVARVPNLAYATVATLSAPALTDGRTRTLSERLGIARHSPPLALSLDTQATTPALPAADRHGLVTVTQSTSLALQLKYDLPAGCTAHPVVSVYALVWNPHTKRIKSVELGSRGVGSNEGTETYHVPLSASDNGTWVFASLAACNEPGKRFPRYALISAGPGFVVNIGASAPDPSPAISAAPADANVVDGSTATFNVTAQGEALAYEWQRSNDGGVSYAAVGANNSASYSFAAGLSDNNALIRVRVSNAAGSTTSTPAKLTVTARVIAPVVTTDPANQTVLEGETASFIVVGTGQPAPSVQWQQRAAANTDAEAGWSDMVGATANTYTTPALALAQSGMQLRALLRNAGGTAASLPALLSVNARVVAPAITTTPQSLSVTAGQFGALAVAATGTSPLSYQWFKNGQAITGANASDILVYADPADVGGSYQITVQVSNAAGRADSAAAVLSITAAPTTSTGTLVKAGEPAAVPVTGDVALVLPANALTSDTLIAIGTQAGASVALPQDFTAMSDAYDITPTGMFFAAPAVLTLPAPDVLPEGTVLALVELASSSSPQRAFRAANVSANVNVRKLAMGAGPSSRRSIAAVDSASSVLCMTPANSRGGFLSVNISRAARYISAAVPEGACQGTAPSPSKKRIPSTTTAPCADSDYPDPATTVAASILSRHVSCGAGGMVAFEYFEDPSIAVNGQQRSYGTLKLEWRVGLDGPAKGLTATYRLRYRLTQVSAAQNQSPSPLTLTLRPEFRCNASAGEGTGQCTQTRSRQFVSVTAGSGWSTADTIKVTFSSSAGDGTWTEFNPQV